MSQVKKVQGLIAYYNLQDWWASAFSESERDFINNRYNPMGSNFNNLTQGNIDYCSQHVTQFLSALSMWFIKTEELQIFRKIHDRLNIEAQTHPLIEAGCFNGRHYTTYVEEVKVLKRDGRLDDAENLLLKLLDVIELESKSKRRSVAPWYYWELAVIYRKQNKPQEEVNIIARYLKQIHGEGENFMFIKRMSKAQQLLSRKR